MAFAVRPFPTSERLKGPNPDFKFQCTDGVVLADAWIIWKTCEYISGMMEIDNNFRLITIEYPKDLLEEALTWVYGLVVTTQQPPFTTLGLHHPVQIPLKLFPIFKFLQVDVLMHHEYYRRECEVFNYPNEGCMEEDCPREYTWSESDYLIPKDETIKSMVKWLKNSRDIPKELLISYENEYAEMISRYIVGVCLSYNLQDDLFCLLSDLPRTLIAKLNRVIYKMFWSNPFLESFSEKFVFDYTNLVVDRIIGEEYSDKEFSEAINSIPTLFVKNEVIVQHGKKMGVSEEFTERFIKDLNNGLTFLVRGRISAASIDDDGVKFTYYAGPSKELYTSDDARIFELLLKLTNNDAKLFIEQHCSNQTRK